MAKKRKHPSDKRKLSAGEQQLKATIQQLRASEQQLKAANQQFEASNRQLRESEQEIRRMEQNWRESFNSLEDVMILIDRDFNVEKINANGLKLVGKSEENVVGKKCYEIVHGLSAPAKGCPLKKSLRTKKVESTDRFEEDFGRHFWIKSSPIFDEKGKIVRFVDLMRDITERKQAEEALRAANEQLRASEQQLKAANEQLRASEQQLRAANQQLRANEQQLRAANQQLRANEQQLKATNQQLRANEQQLKAANEQLQASEQQLKAANEQLRASEQQLRASNQQLQASEQQLKSLASQLTLAEESERHRIATELHATIGQSLVVSKLQLDTLRASTPAGDIAKTLGEVCNSLDETIQGTRSLTFDLSSPLLYELGFEAAVAEWLTERIQQKHRIATEFEDDGQPKPLDDDVRVFLFRDVRELLMNVVKHAQAKKVKVSIRRVGRQIEVSVKDDGWGFDPKKVAATAVRKGGFGLFSIRERLEQLGGHLDIESSPGQGTKVTVMAPFREEKINKGQ